VASRRRRPGRAARQPPQEPLGSTNARCAARAAFSAHRHHVGWKAPGRSPRCCWGREPRRSSCRAASDATPRASARRMARLHRMLRGRPANARRPRQRGHRGLSAEEPRVIRRPRGQMPGGSGSCTSNRASKRWRADRPWSPFQRAVDRERLAGSGGGATSAGGRGTSASSPHSAASSSSQERVASSGREPGQHLFISSANPSRAAAQRGTADAAEHRLPTPAGTNRILERPCSAASGLAGRCASGGHVPQESPVVWRADDRRIVLAGTRFYGLLVYAPTFLGPLLLCSGQQRLVRLLLVLRC